MGTSRTAAAEQEGRKCAPKLRLLGFNRRREKPGSAHARNVGVIIMARTWPPVWGLGWLTIGMGAVVRSSHHSLVNQYFSPAVFTRTNKVVDQIHAA